MMLEPRECPSCRLEHPALTTCAGGWAPWDGSPVSVARSSTVALTSRQVESARTCAERMERESDNRKAFADRGGLDGSDRERSFEFTFSGICGEVAVASFLGTKYRCRTGRFGAEDVAGVHVRTTRHRFGHLIIRHHEKHGRYVLVIDERPRMRLAGWIDAEVARANPTYVRKLDSTRPTSYAVPQSDLRSPDLLVAA